MISSRPNSDDRCCVNSKYINWAELPRCVLNGIMDRLILLDDYVNFGAVCVSWRTAFDEDNKKKRSQSSFPFLLVSTHDHKEEEEEEEEEEAEAEAESHYKSIRRPSTYNGHKLLTSTRNKRRPIPQTRSLYNVLSQKVCTDFEVQLPHDYYCRGSSFGWLITMKPQVKDDYYYQYFVQLYNPFLSADSSKNIINLPPLFKILKIKQEDFSYGVMDGIYHRPFFYLRKAVLSCNPMFNSNNFVVMAIMGPQWKLAFYTQENQDWTPINWEREDWSYFEDVIYFSRTQQFYAALPTGEVLAIDLIPNQGGGPCIIPKLTQVAPPTHGFAANGLRYLVETSSGELLQVYKQLDFCTASCIDNCLTTAKFEVFKLDLAGLAWSQIHDMGDTVLFLGDNSSISRTASDFPGCKPNCIYYTDDVSTEQEAGGLYNPQDMGVYNLANGTHQPHYPTASRINFPAPIWLEPTLPRSFGFDT